MQLYTVARTVRTMALGVWLGGIVMAFIVAPIVFKHLPKDRILAGNINAEMFHTAGKVKLVLGLIALAAEGFILFRKPEGSPQGGIRRFLTAGSLLAALVIAIFVFAYLEPKMLDVRDKIADFGPNAAESPERLQFRQLHGASMALSLLEAVLVALAIIAGLL